MQMSLNHDSTATAPSSCLGTAWPGQRRQANAGTMHAVNEHPDLSDRPGKPSWIEVFLAAYT